MQDSTGARATIRTTNTTYLVCNRTQFDNLFQLNGANIVGQSTGATAVVTSIEQDLSTNVIGLNALIGSSVQTGNGAVTSLDVYDSGFGYYDNELVTITIGY